MGRLEKQIITGAVALVAILLIVVLVKGIEQKTPSKANERKSEWQDPSLLLSKPESPANSTPESSMRAAVVNFEDANPGEEAPTKSSLVPASGTPGLHAGTPAGTMPVVTEPVPASASTENTFKPVGGASQAGKMVNLDWDEGLRLYIVKENESLSEIAQREVGSIHYLDSILELNEGLSANKIFLGQEIWLPTEQAAKSNRDLKQFSRQKNSSTANAAKVKVSGRSHKVASGDSLWKIARKYYPKDERNDAIAKIVKANKQLKSENTVLVLDDELRVPR